MWTNGESLYIGDCRNRSRDRGVGSIKNPHLSATPRCRIPPMADYVDGLVKGDTVQQQAYIAACAAVKAKYPKP